MLDKSNFLDYNVYSSTYWTNNNKDLKKGKGVNDMKFYIEKKQGKKEGSSYLALFCDLGYRVVLVTMETAIIVELSGKTFKEINDMKVGTIINIGELK